MYAAIMNTALGSLLIKANDRAVTSIHFLRDNETIPELLDNELTDQCIIELGEYFSGIRVKFSVPLAPNGTQFQQSVWQTLKEIPYGKTCSYGEIAKKLGNPKAARAIGMANNRNPIPIIIPCHRVLGSNGSLTGYAGGLDNKSYLLNLESKLPDTL
ncbi:methylated-DNA--[protein]-cysteine S-methyltransferase [uncultured Neptuniibacter sp.]|uniref:methylated-DNA--[protein]-cysteine S-methyltransferase n=1 Tax=uncultured Neptuniibacter sp. TaxID=502143 RepID=UPI002621BA8E|nr:methylated-DNA--[protein]-cysteine S-methyltransferase [uncultured Neptuniibacter sp.]